MKNLLIFVFLISSFNSTGQDIPQLLFEQTIKNIGIKDSDIYHRLATSHKFDNGTLLVIPEIAEQGEGYIVLNSHIVLLDEQTNRIKAKFTGNKAWFLDAVGIDMIEIEPELYHLNSSTIAFGLQIFYSGDSKTNPYHATNLSLYAFRGNNLDQVLKDHPIKSFSGETAATCLGIFKQHSKTLKILNRKTNGYADLKFTDTIEIFERNRDCLKTRIETNAETEILKYKNEEYVIVP